MGVSVGSVYAAVNVMYVVDIMNGWMDIILCDMVEQVGLWGWGHGVSGWGEVGWVGRSPLYIRTYIPRYSKIAVSWKICKCAIQLRPQIFSD